VALGFALSRICNDLEFFSTCEKLIRRPKSVELVGFQP
jgi:hypothetical protein